MALLPGGDRRPAKNSGCYERQRARKMHRLTPYFPRHADAVTR